MSYREDGSAGVGCDKARERMGVVTLYRRLMSEGTEEEAAAWEAARRWGCSPQRVRRWDERYDGSVESLADRRRSGRPARVVVSEEDARLLRAEYVRSNRTRDAGSMTFTARRLAREGRLAPDLCQEILRTRSSKHILPAAVKRAMSGAEALVGHHRAPTRAGWDLGYAPGVLRRHWAGERRLLAGERESWDDGTINLVVAVPWPWGGCKASDRWGWRAGRFQLLLCHDDATSFVPGFSFVMRPQSSYRGADVAAACGRLWRDVACPERVVFERGVWESKVVKGFLDTVGVECDRAYMPRQKLVENYFNRLWTALSVEDGQVGRFRGEMERENRELRRAQSGSVDPRSVFPEIDVVMQAIERGIRWLNAEVMESKTYGTWVPEERYREDLERQPRGRLDAGMAWAWAPEQRVWRVRQGLAGGKVASPVGVSVPYFFGADDLYEFEGRDVRVSFDPCEDPCRAVVSLAEDWPARGLRAGHVVAREAECLTDNPSLIEDAAGWMADVLPAGGAERARALRKTYAQAVRREYRALGVGGRRVAAGSEKRDGIGGREVVEVSFGEAAPADAIGINSSPTREAAPASGSPTGEAAPASPGRRRRDWAMEQLGVDV